MSYVLFPLASSFLSPSTTLLTDIRDVSPRFLRVGESVNLGEAREAVSGAVSAGNTAVMDDDFEDLLGDGGSEPGKLRGDSCCVTDTPAGVSVAGDVREPTVGFGGPDTAQDDMGEESVSKPKGGFPDRMPSENELVLGRRVLELEKERDSMQVRVS
jgi:hypothetical protein